MQNKQQYAIGFYLGYPFLWLLGWVPLGLLYGLADLLYLLVKTIGYRKKVIDQNLLKAFPNKSEKERDEIRKRFYHHFADLFVETLVLQHSKAEQIHKRVEVENFELMEALLAEGNDIVAVSAHYGNWEWVPAASLGLKALGTSVYRPLKNPYFDRFMLNLRSLYGSRNIPLKNVAREIVGFKRQKQRFILGLISDQSPSKYELQYWTTFLTQDTPVILGPEKMARLAKAKVVYWQMDKIKRGRYRMRFIPYPGDELNDPEFAVTEWHVRLLEAQIQEHPEFWLWSHKRWKYQHLKNK